MRKRIKISKNLDNDVWGIVGLKGKKGLSLNYFTDKIIKDQKRIDFDSWRSSVYNRRSRRLPILSELREWMLWRDDLDLVDNILNLRYNTFVYKKRKTFFGKVLHDRKKILAYYGSLRKKELKCLFGKGKRGSRVLSILESRLDVIVYKMNFSLTIFEAKNLVKSGAFLVNKKIIKKPNFEVKVGDIIEVSEVYKETIFDNLSNWIEKGQYVMGLPKHLEVNYWTLSGVCHSVVTEVINPLNVDWNVLVSNFYSKI